MVAHRNGRVVLTDTILPCSQRYLVEHLLSSARKNASGNLVSVAASRKQDRLRRPAKQLLVLRSKPEDS